jgi:hypothetical protein
VAVWEADRIPARAMTERDPAPVGLLAPDSTAFATPILLGSGARASSSRLDGGALPRALDLAEPRR